MPGSSFRAWLMIAALLAAAATAGYDIYLRQAAPAAPTVAHAPPSAAELARATEPLRRELEAAKLALAAIAADRDNLKQQLDALNKPAPAPAGDKAKDRAKDKAKEKDKDKSAAAMQKQLEAAQRQRDAALSEAAALKRRTQQLEAQPRPRRRPRRSRRPPAASSIRNDRSPNCASFMPAARRRRARHRRPTKPANGSRRRACGSSASPAAAFCC